MRRDQRLFGCDVGPCRGRRRETRLPFDRASPLGLEEEAACRRELVCTTSRRREKVVPATHTPTLSLSSRYPSSLSSASRGGRRRRESYVYKGQCGEELPRRCRWRWSSGSRQAACLRALPIPPPVVRVLVVRRPSKQASCGRVGACVLQVGAACLFDVFAAHLLPDIKHARTHSTLLFFFFLFSL